MIQTCRHDYDVLLFGISSSQDLAQIVKIFGITDRNHDVARTHTQGVVCRLLVSIYAKLVKTLRFPGSTLCNPSLRISKEREEHQAERDSTYGGGVLCEQVDQGSEEKHGRDQYHAQRQFATFTQRDIQRHLPVPSRSFGVPQHQYRERHHREAPDHTKCVKAGQSKYVSAGDDDGEQLQTDD